LPHRRPSSRPASLSELGRRTIPPIRAFLELRLALAEHLERLYGVRYDPETELLITVGVSEALYLALAATLDHGDEVLVPEPCFVSYNPEVIFAGGVPVNICTRVENDFQLLAWQVEEPPSRTGPRPCCWAIPTTPPAR
jgi:aspartate/methionine/tyrosine aminotransferase